MSEIASARRTFLRLAGLGASAFFAEACTRLDPGGGPVGQMGAPICDATGVLPVVNVLEHPTFQDAADAAAGGKILYFPEGTHEVTTPILLKPKTHVMGVGRGTVLHRSGAAWSVFELDGVDGVRIESLAIDVDAGPKPESVGILVSSTPSPCTDVSLDHLDIFTSSALAAGQRAYAIAAHGGTGLRFTDNRVTGLDLVGSLLSASAVTIARNHIVGPPFVGVGLYAQGAADVISQCVIEDNLIEDPRQFGIHLGPAAENVLVAAIRAIVIRNNIVRGAWGAIGAGLLARLAADTRDWIVEGNVFEADVALNNTQGIRISAEHPSCSGTSIAVIGNIVRNVDLAGVAVAGPIAGVRVAENRVDHTRGISIVAMGAGMSDAIVAGNAVRGGTLSIDASAASAGPVLVRGNVCMNGAGWDSAGIKLHAEAGMTLQADVAGNRSGDDQAQKTQHWGGMEDGDGTFDTRWVDNDLSGNLHGAMGSVSAGALLRDNAGLPTRASGVATLNGGVASLAVAHGLAFAPSSADVTLTVITPPASWTTNGVGHVWLSATTASEIDVAASPPPLAGESLVVGWQASVRDA